MFSQKRLQADDYWVVLYVDYDFSLPGPDPNQDFCQEKHNKTGSQLKTDIFTYKTPIHTNQKSSTKVALSPTALVLRDRGHLALTIHQPVVRLAEGIGLRSTGPRSCAESSGVGF